MSDAERNALRDTHPNLHHAVQHGPLTEANEEFVAIAAQYPIQESSN